MPTRTRPTEPEAPSNGLKEYVVIADAVNIVTGKKPSGAPQVTRALRGTTINAPEGHAGLADLIDMGGVVLKSDLAETVKALRAKGSLRRPTVLRTEDGIPRITAAGTAVNLAPADDPTAPAVEDVQPIPAPDPDLSGV